MTASLPRHRRWPLAATALLALTLVGCGSENDSDEATDPAPSSASASGEPTQTPSADESSEATSEEGALPAWAPQIITDGDAVTGLDFTDTPEPGAELEVATVIEGDGPPVEVGQMIEVNYYGSLYQGEAAFDESYSRGQTVTFPIGTGGVIKGWDQGIPGVAVGSRIIMSIPADLAYGAEGRPPVIPADSPLYFVVDIVNATDAG